MGLYRVCKIRIFGLSDQKDSILTQLQKMGSIHLIQTEADNAARIKDEISSLRYKAEIILSRYEKTEKKTFLEKIRPDYVEEEQFLSIQEADIANYRKLLEEIWSKMQELSDLEGRLLEIAKKLHELEPWKNMTVSFDELKSSAYFQGSLFRMPSRFFEDAKKCLFGQAELELVAEAEDFSYLVVFLYKDDLGVFGECARNFGLEEYVPAVGTHSISEQCLMLRQEKDRLEKRAAEVALELSLYQPRLSELKLFYDCLLSAGEKNSADRNVRRGDYTFFFDAWVAEEHLKELNKMVERHRVFDYERIEPEENEVAPVYLKNNSFTRPFEFVTAMFGYPAQKEADPTPVLAPFFALFLAICLTEGGYGLVLTLAGIIYLKFFRQDESSRKLYGILTLTGVLTIVVGLLTGGFFAIDTSPGDNDNFLKQFIRTVTIIDPVNNKDHMMIFMALCIGIGYFHVMLAYVLSFIYKIRQGLKKEAFFDVLPWIAILAGGTGVIQHVALPDQYPVLLKAGLTLMLVGAVTVLFFAGRESKGPVGRFFSGLYSLYGVTSIFGDILSYARLFALGVATGIIAGVVNRIAGNFLTGLDFQSVGSALVSGLNVLFFLLIIVGGHLFNLLMNTLGGFIHSTRLQFVEFFGKYFQGGGEVFTPFAWKLKYFVLKQKKNREVL